MTSYTSHNTAIMPSVAPSPTRMLCKRHMWWLLKKLRSSRVLASEALRLVSVLCAQVLRALQACFQCDSGAFVTPELFRRVLPPLVAQLRGGPPGEVQASFVADAAPGEAAAASSRDSAAGDAYAQTAVATLIELAASAGNDELWKPFNHQVPFHNPPC